jgi:dTDP-4-amino-4,6-dideoxygalactose transaminase
MQKIQMVDLISQYHEIKEEVDEAVQRVMDSAAFIKGPEVKCFQEDLQNYLDVKHVISCANGTDALQIALMALGLKPGDEVITTNFTFAATVEVIHLLGLKSVLIDVDRDTFNLDVEDLKSAINNNTKAIIPVHLYGQCANMEEIMKIAKEFKLFVVEDTAQAIGATYQFSNGKTLKSGTIGDIGTTSFFPSKNLGCMGDGGAVFTNSDDLANRLAAISNHGMWKRYYHDEVGVNSRLDSIQAAILRVKLKRLDQYNTARRKAADYYTKSLHNIDGIETPFIDKKSSHVFHQYTLKIASHIDRNGLQDYLQSKDIPSMIYYPLALHQQKAYRDPLKNDKDFPVTMELIDTVISLPMHTELNKEQQDYIIETIIEYINLIK